MHIFLTAAYTLGVPLFWETYRWSAVVVKLSDFWCRAQSS